MQFNIDALSGAQQRLTQCFLQQYGHEICAQGCAIHMIPCEEAKIRVQQEGENLYLYAQKEVQFYRALHLFLQALLKAQQADISIEETAAFEHTGLMLDASRNGTLQITQLQEFVRLCAATGIDRIFLYMEDVYEVPQEPYFGAYRGRYRYDELKELDDYAHDAGVEIVPTIQTLAHLRIFLRWQSSQPLRDTADILLVGSEKTKTFLRNMIHSATRPFRSAFVHVGMDEADFVGLGQYLHQNGYQERAKVMQEHLALVKGICAQEGKSLMMWSDMFLRLLSPTGGYYDIEEQAEFSLPEAFDPQVNLVYWDYYQHAQSIYEKNIRLHQKLTTNLQFAGGGWTWNGISPNYSKAKATLQEGLRACRAYDIPQVMCTFWLDNGAETPVRTAFFSAIYFAELCYHDTVSDDAFARWVKQITGYAPEEHMLLDAFDALPGTQKENQNADNPSKFLLYQDPLVGLFDAQIAQTKVDLNVYYATLAQKLSAVVAAPSNAPNMQEIFAYYQVLAQVLSHKAMLGIQLKKSYDAQDYATLKAICAQIEACIPLVADLKARRANLWFAEIRPFGFEVLDLRMGGVQTRLESTLRRVEQYLKGEICAIPELEEPRLLFAKDEQDVNHTLCASGFWENIVSAASVAGI